MPKGIPRDSSTERKIAHRLRIAKGHLDKVIKMVEKGEYCIDVIHQSMAVQSALKKTDEIILKNHLNTCVAEAIKRGEKDEVISEIIKIFEKK